MKRSDSASQEEIGEEPTEKKLKQARTTRKLGRKSGKRARIAKVPKLGRVPKATRGNKEKAPAVDQPSRSEERERVTAREGSLPARLLDAVRSTIRPYRVTTAKAVRYPRTRTTSTRTRTTFYVAAPLRQRQLERIRTATEEAGIAVYLDTENEAAIFHVLNRVDEVRSLLGYDAEQDVDVTYGSIFRRAQTRIRAILTSDEAQERLLKVERAIELSVVDSRQADYDEREAVAVRQLIESLQDIARACVRVGSILIVKYQVAGEAVIFVRNLSQPEIRALERYPEMQQAPEKIFSALAMALDSMDRVNADAQGVREVEG